MNTLGSRIDALRKEQNLTIQKLADKCNISKEHMGDIIRNRTNPSLDALTTIAKALDTTVSYLLGEDVPKHAPEPESKTQQLEEEFPEGVEVLMRANKKLTPKAKRKLVKLMKAFLEEEDEEGGEDKKTK